jgi:3-oxoacyl-[acyl-carrier protein] reductase
VKKTALITGASRGIGRNIAKALASPGGDFDCIIMLARPSATFDDAISDVRNRAVDCEVYAIEADLANLDSATRIYDELDDLGVRLTTIINNAGYTKPAAIVDTQLEDFLLTIQVNMLAPFIITKNAINRGHPVNQIINIASTAGVSGRSGWLSYSASKAALINMSEVMREELSPRGIDVICLSPGRCATDLRRILAPNEDPSTIMQPDQVASVVRLMTSEIGRLLLSQNIIVRI